MCGTSNSKAKVQNTQVTNLVGHTFQLSAEKNPGQSVAEAAYSTKQLRAKSFPL